MGEFLIQTATDLHVKKVAYFKKILFIKASGQQQL